MKIKYVVLLAFAIQCSVFGAGKGTVWKPQPGYWYNDTDSEMKLFIFARFPGAYEAVIDLEPYELVKMTPFRKTEYAGTAEEDKWIMYNVKKKKSKNSMIRSLDRRLLGNLGSEYVIIFQNDPTNEGHGLKSFIMPEKEFREKYSKELQNLPLPGGVQRMIPGYLFPEAEKTKSKE